MTITRYKVTVADSATGEVLDARFYTLHSEAIRYAHESRQSAYKPTAVVEKIVNGVPIAGGENEV